MKYLNYMSIAEDAINKIKKGAFLTVKAADVLNTMTIGWATFGFIWQKPVMMVAVRSSRRIWIKIMIRPSIRKKITTPFTLARY